MSQTNPQHFLEMALAHAASGNPCALAVVVRASGSTPQKPGAKALFEKAGPIHGTLGGGCLEAESRQRALEAIEKGGAFAFDLNLDDDYGWDDGLICGGKVRVMVISDLSQCVQAFEGALASLKRRETGALQYRLAPTVTVEWISCTASNPQEWREIDGGEIFSEFLAPQPSLLIAGGGHVGQAVARLAHWAGFDVTVVDDRPAFADPALYPQGVHTRCGDIPTEVARFAKDENTYIVIVTRGHRHDGVVLKECIHAPAAYLGMIGSKRKVHIIRKGFIEEGIAAPETFDRVRSPMGLDIGSVTVEEIAVSIVAELVAVRRGRLGSVQPMAVFAK